jgi:hypothetical protein
MVIKKFDFRTPDDWVYEPSADLEVHNHPIPVPSECIDFTPPKLWNTMWKHYPNGTELPATVPKDVWKRKGLAPAFRKGYWGKLNTRALTERKRSGKPDKPNELPDVLQPRLSHDFWEDYFRLYPNGHPAPGFGQQQGPDIERPKYKFIGTLHVNAGTDKCPWWKPSTGCDAWVDDRWAGPG